MNDECKYYRELEETYDDLPYDEDIEELWRMNEYPVSDETLNEIYEKLEEWDENSHLYDFGGFKK